MVSVCLSSAYACHTYASCEQVCMYACEHVCMLACEHVRMLVCEHARMRTCSHASIYAISALPSKTQMCNMLQLLLLEQACCPDEQTETVFNILSWTRRIPFPDFHPLIVAGKVCKKRLDKQEGQKVKQTKLNNLNSPKTSNKTTRNECWTSPSVKR